MKYILLSLLLVSCGTRKVDIQQRDSIHVENNYSQGSKIVLSNTFTYRPFDSLKPMVIDNIVYKNVIITNDKSKIVEKWKNRNIIKTITVEKTKETHKNNNLVFIALIVCGFVFLWFYLPKIRI